MTIDPTFLIVDDDLDDVSFFHEAIEALYPSPVCRSAVNGEDCLRLLRMDTKILPDLIFLDLNMPRMDGRQCLIELKQDERLKDIPVIIYTTSDHQRDREEMLKLGAAYFLTKSTSFDKLQEGISGAIDKVRSASNGGA